MPMVTVRMSQELKDRLDEQAISKDTSINQLAVRAIERLMNELAPPPSRPIEQAEDFDEPCSE